MSYKGKGQQTYVERFPYEGQIEDQVKIFRMASTENDIEVMQNAVEALHDLVVDLLGEHDVDFKVDMDKLSAEFEADYEARLIEFNEKAKLANCPDVVSKPSDKMDRDQLRKMFRVLIKLCHRSEILLTSRNESVF